MGFTRRLYTTGVQNSFTANNHHITSTHSMFNAQPSATFCSPVHRFGSKTHSPRISVSFCFVVVIVAAAAAAVAVAVVAVVYPIITAAIAAIAAVAAAAAIVVFVGGGCCRSIAKLPQMSPAAVHRPGAQNGKAHNCSMAIVTSTEISCCLLLCAALLDRNVTTFVDGENLRRCCRRRRLCSRRPSAALLSRNGRKVSKT